jgi:hypothetical protein
MYFNVAGTSGAMVLDSSGNVGIGDTSPDTKLHVYGNVKVGSAASAAWATSIQDAGGLDVVVGSGSTGFRVWDDNSQTTPRFIVKRDGNVGIGTTSPASNLHVETAGNANIRIQAGTNSSASLRLRNDAHDWDVNCQTNDKFAIYSHTAGTERLVIDTSGNVGIGQTSPTSKLHVDAGTFAGYAVDLVQGGSGGGNHGLRVVSGSASSYTAIFRANAATVFYVDGSGNYYFSGSNQSDVNKKENIADLTDNALDLITQLQPKTYNFIGNDIDKAGFIAQEMEQVIPRLVSGNEFDPDASDDVTTNPTGKGIDYMGYTAYLTKAIQEQQVLIEQLQAEVALLKGE